MARLEISDEELEIEVEKLMPWSKKRYKNGRRDCHPDMFKDGEIKDWLPRRFVKKVVILLQRGYSRREVAYRFGCHRHTIEFIAVGKAWHHRSKVEVPAHLKPKAGRKAETNRPEKVEDNRLKFTPEQEQLIIEQCKHLLADCGMLRIKFPPMGQPPKGFPRAFGKQKTTTNSADFWPKWREYTPLSVLTYFSKLGKIDISEEELRLLDAKAKEMKKKLEQL